MALKADAETIMDRASRILSLLRLRSLTRIEIEENPDLAVDISPQIKQAWNAKIDSLQAEIVAIVQAWR